MTNKSGEETNARRRWRLPSMFRRRRRAKSVDSERVPSEQSFSFAPVQPSAPQTSDVDKGQLAIGWNYPSPQLRTPSLAVTEDRFTAASWDASEAFCRSDDNASFQEGILVRQLIHVTDRGVQTDPWPQSRTTGEEENAVELVRIILLPFVIWLLIFGFLLRLIVFVLIFGGKRAKQGAFGSSHGNVPNKNRSSHFANPIEGVVRACVGLLLAPVLVPFTIFRAMSVCTKTVAAFNPQPLFQLLQFVAKPRPRHHVLLNLPRGRGRPCRCRCNVM